MDVEISITPTGRLVADTSDDAAEPSAQLTPAAVKSLREALEESSAAGLMRLPSDALHGELSPVLVFWREFSLLFFQELCGLGEETLSQAVGSKGLTALTPPEERVLSSFVDNAPPMRGLEYLSAGLLRSLWDELQEFVLSRMAKHDGGPVAFLHGVNPLWNLLGRVTFHLAENKRDPERPFAFLATYAHRISVRSKLQHLPLAEALKQYAGEKNQARLAALLEPVRRAADESPLVRELLDSRRLFQPQAWTIREAHRFLLDVPHMENSGVVVRVPDWWQPRQPTRPEVQVRIGQQPTSRVGMDSLLDFSIELALEGDPLTDDERQQILSATDGLTLLRGRWVEVDQDKLRQALDHWQKIETEYADGVDFIQGMRMLAGVRISADGEVDETADWTQISAGGWLSETLSRLREPSGVVGCDPGRDLQATLRPYQADGVRWLWFMTRLGLGACLADDMGLGKTIQCIDLLLMLKRDSKLAAETTVHQARHSTPEKSRKRNGASADKKRGADAAAIPPCSTPSAGKTSLLVVPASLIGNWKSEFERFAPSLHIFYAHRSECDADRLGEVADDPDTSLAEFDVVVTTYGLVRRLEWFGKHPWRLVVLDEAQAIKNASSAQSKNVRRLQAPGRIVLTGTPVENHLRELWSIFDFCCPGLLGNANQFKKFVKQLNRKQDAKAYGALRRLVRPYILRRMKTDPGIIPDLPDKTEMRAECGLSKKQVTLYEKSLKDLENRLKQSSEGIERRGLVLATLMQLKQICNHPSQFLNQSEYPTRDSGKFQRLELICDPIVERQERVLIFTQFRSLTEPLADFLAGVFGRSGLVLHGSVPVKKRKELVNEFQRDDGPPFFVISVKAGGTGLNLTAASHVVHFDRWWNPAVENQATDRAFRIGQTRNVLVHKFVCRGTVEERIDEMIREKQNLADEILSGGAETLLTEMSDRELLDFVAIDISRAVADD